jgi:signal transduction histidine kinase
VTVEAEAEGENEVEAEAEGESEAVVVLGSADRLARALGHLVDNAARHARSQVRITVGTGGTTATTRLVVDDDGPGIPPADRERVFERFTRLDDARTRAAGGTGLGLAVTHAIVTAHHGTITAAANPTGGARFTITLPRAHTSRST